MDSKEKLQLIFERINRVLWFFLCIFGSNAAMGVFNNLLQYPDDQLLMQLGFFGGAATMVVMGLLQLAQAFIADGLPTVRRVAKGSVFILTLCGAAAALGIYYFELMGDNDAVYLMAYGLLSLAAALLLTGSLKLGEAYLISIPGEEGAGR